MATPTFTRSKVIPNVVATDGAASTLAADRSGEIDVEGFNQCTLYIDYLHQNTITALYIYVSQRLPRKFDGTNLRGDVTYYYAEEDLSAPPDVTLAASGAANPRRRYSVDVSGLTDNTTYRFMISFPIQGSGGLKVEVDETGDEATATILIDAELSVQ